jgi:hypothetical protein
VVQCLFLYLVELDYFTFIDEMTINFWMYLLEGYSYAFEEFKESKEEVKNESGSKINQMR